MTEFKSALQNSKEYGIVVSVEHPIVKVQGLPNAKMSEIVVFENNEIGHISALKEKYVEIVAYSQTPIYPGTRLTRTDQLLSITIAEEILGKVVNPFCVPLFESDQRIDYKTDPEVMEIDTPPMSLNERVRVTRQLLTGVTVIDTLIPLGKGQRELVVGDRKTGKTSVLLTMIKTQVQEGAIVVYASIGKEKTSTKKLSDFFTKNDLMKNVVIVSTASDDSPSLIDLTPYSAMTIAEYFRKRGKDVLVIFDDLTTHAKYYREMTLLSKRFPGRDSYPGDIFYKHARLLERAGNFRCDKTDLKESAITALALGETINTSLTDYIVSNLISITDGHIYFDERLFNKGIRPAVDIFLSVTRVGKQTQDPITRHFNREIMQLMSRYEKSSNFKHFGAELTDEIKTLLLKGDQIYAFLEQSYQRSIPLPIQKIMLGMLFQEGFSTNTPDDIKLYKKNLYQEYKTKEVREYIDSLANSNDIKKFLESITKEKFKITGLCTRIQD